MNRLPAGERYPITPGLMPATSRFWASILVVGLLAAVASTAQASSNVLVNGDFESTPPPNFGNNIGWPITPWVLGTSGQTSNVVKVDGVYNYGTNGPWLDASGSPAGVKRHYLDIANGANDFYQPFTPPCTGQVEFGGFFSTRANSNGTASIKIVQGVGTGTNPTLPVIGVTNTINLPGGNSAKDPWTPASFTANLTAGTTYSFVVTMDNNMNFDEAYVRYKIECGASPTPSPTVTVTPSPTVRPTPSPTARPSASPTATPSATPISTGCAQVAAKEVRCEPKGGYSYTFSVANNSGSAMSQILLTPAGGSTFTVAPPLSNLSSPLANGQSTTVTIIIGGAKPGDNVCFFVSLMADGAPCCTTQICATMPQCGTSPTPTPTPTPADCWCCVDMPGGMGVANTTKENCTQHGVGPQGAECFATEAAAVDYCYPVWCCTTAPDGSVSIIKTTEADCVARHNGVNGNYYPTKELAIAACQEPPGTWCCAPATDSHGLPIHEAFPADAQQCAAHGGQLFNTEAEALASCNMCWCCPRSGSGEYFLMGATDCKNSNLGAQCFASKAEAMACAAPTSPTPTPAQKPGRRR